MDYTLTYTKFHNLTESIILKYQEVEYYSTCIYSSREHDLIHIKNKYDALLITKYNTCLINSVTLETCNIEFRNDLQKKKYANDILNGINVTKKEYQRSIKNAVIKEAQRQEIMRNVRKLYNEI